MAKIVDLQERAYHIDKALKAVKGSVELLYSVELHKAFLNVKDFWISQFIATAIMQLGEFEEQLEDFCHRYTDGEGCISNLAFDFELAKEVGQYAKEIENETALDFALKKLDSATREQKRIEEQVSLWQKKVTEFTENQPSK